MHGCVLHNFLLVLLPSQPTLLEQVLRATAVPPPQLLLQLDHDDQGVQDGQGAKKKTNLSKIS